MKSATLAPEKVVRNAQTPLFCLKKILVPIDFSPASEEAFAYAVRLAEHFQASLLLFHVVEPGVPAFGRVAQIPAFPRMDSSVAEANFRALIARVGRDEKKGIKWKIRNGLATHEIVAMAKEADADLVVIGSSGFTSGKHFCIGTTAERVARAAPCPVLVVREKEYEF